MGILAGLIGGTARAAGQIADQRIARYTAEELQRQRDLMEQEREKRLEEAQIAKENRLAAAEEKKRTDMVSRIDAESGRLADAEIVKQQGLIFDKNAAPSLTPERLDEIDKELEAKRQALRSDGMTRFQAAMNTGDINPKDAQILMDSKQRLDLTEKQQENAAKIAEMKNATELYKAKLKEDSDLRKDAREAKRLDILLAKIAADSGGSGTKSEKVMTFLEGTRKSLNNEADRLSELLKGELKGAEYDPEAQAKIRASYKPKFDQIAVQQKNLNDDFEQVRQRFGLPARKDSTPSNEDTVELDSLGKAISQRLGQVRGGNASAPAPASGKTTEPQGLIDMKKPSEQAPQKSQSLESILSGGATDKSVTALASRSAQQIKAVADEVKTAGRAYAAAAASGDARVSKMYQDKLNESKRKLDDLLRNMNDSTQENVKQWLGL